MTLPMTGAGGGLHACRVFLPCPAEKCSANGSASRNLDSDPYD